MRARNGWVDDGSKIGKPTPCPNCGSHLYYQTVSQEICPACGLRCDYWGDGTNDVYESMAERHAAEEEHQKFIDRMREEQQLHEDMARWSNEDSGYEN